MAASKTGQKGLDAEECLKAYFLEAGYYVVRGISLMEGSLEVTDVDLWLYMRASALHRTRANVDIKASSRSKALERILWAKGMQQVLGVDEAIVATTDRRSAVKEFAERNSVRLLDGHFLGRLAGRDSASFLTEEQLEREIDADGMDKVRGAWRDRLRASKARLLTSLNFDGCNHWLSEARFFLGRLVASDRPESALRMLYLNLSYFCLGLDYRNRSIAFESEATRQAELLNGLRFGERNMREVEALMKAMAPGAEASFMAVAESGREAILAEYFAGKKAASSLFNVARGLERLAFAPANTSPALLAPVLKSTVALVCDYCEVPRVAVFGV